MSRHLPPELIDEVRERTDIVEVISRYVRLERSGRRLRGLCPFHAEKTPSFYVEPEKQLFHCFGCHAGGNVFNFLMRLENAPFGEVVRRLAEEAGIAVEARELTPQEAKRERELEQIRRALELAAGYYARVLFSEEGASARRYLKGRGLNAQVARVFGLGYAPPTWHALHEHLRGHGIPDEIALKAGLLGRGERGPYDWLRNRITFPIVDTRGRTVGFGGRALGADGPKYLNTAESPVFSKRRQLYGLNIAKDQAARTGRLVVVEGYMDVVGLYRHGFAGAVATLGTAFTQEQARLIKRFAGEVVLAYDADAAGQAATLRGLELLRGEGLEVRIVELPEGHDPDSLVLQHGLDAFEELLERSLPLVEYQMKEALRGVDLASVRGRMQATERLLPILASVDNPVGREGYVTQLAARLGVSRASLFEALEAYLSRKNRAPGARSRGRAARHNLSRGSYTNRDLAPRTPADDRSGTSAGSPVEAGAHACERDLLRCLLDEPARAGEVRRSLGDEPFGVAEYNRLFRWLVAQGETEVHGETVVGRIDDPALAALAGALLVQGERPPGPFEAYLNRVKEVSLRRQVNELEATLSQLMNEEIPSTAELGRLVQRYKELRDRIGVADHMRALE